jgi:hypothetical protein
MKRRELLQTLGAPNCNLVLVDVGRLAYDDSETKLALYPQPGDAFKLWIAGESPKTICEGLLPEPSEKFAIWQFYYTHNFHASEYQF